MQSITVTNGTNTFTFDNTMSGSLIESYEGFESAGIISVVEPLPGQSGAVFIDSDWIQRVLSWQGHLMGTSSDNALELRRDLMAVFKQGELVTIKFTTYDSLQLQTTGFLSNINLPYDRALQRYLVEVTCPDHRFYTQSQVTQTTGVTTSSGGFAIPTAVPIDMSSSSGNPRLTVTNAGNEYAPATFVISGPGTNFTVQNVTTGEKFDLNITLTTGETATINTTNKTAVQGTGTNVYGDFDGDFWLLAPGANSIHFNADSGTNSNTQLSVQFRSAYRGI